MTQTRKQRKLDHINIAMKLTDPFNGGWFGDISMIHNCLPEVNFTDVNTSASLCGLNLEFPLIINAMTGGIKEAEDINRSLSMIAASKGLAIAVGSQTAGLQNRNVRESYKIVRRINPDGIVIANVSAGVPLEWMMNAVEMLEADAIQIHLNPAQELFMPEGDRNFHGYLEKITQLASISSIPVIVKETGCGIAGTDALRIAKSGVKGIDIGGRGGTSFIDIEHYRAEGSSQNNFSEWGIPTVASLVECVQKTDAYPDINIIASGGIRTGIDIAKCVALGACSCGIAAPFLRTLINDGFAVLDANINKIIKEFKIAMTLAGANSIAELGKVSLVISGKTAEWLICRGYDVAKIARS